MVSGFVQSEWEHALSLKRANFVRPVFWQKPRPEAPGLPPAELDELQFYFLPGLSGMALAAAQMEDEPTRVLAQAGLECLESTDMYLEWDDIPRAAPPPIKVEMSHERSVPAASKSAGWVGFLVVFAVAVAVAYALLR